MKLNRDSRLKTQSSDSHPVATGVGAAGGAVAGHATVTAVNPTAEDAYWSANYGTRDYVVRHRPYAEYRSAYQYGWESRARLGDRPFREVESDLGRGWDKAKGDCKLVWAEAKQATRDAWHRIV